jgi:hypothetical protein
MATSVTRIVTGTCLALACARGLLADDCATIITHGLRNIEISQSSDDSIAARYFNHCEQNFDSLDDRTMASINVEIFGEGAGGANYSRTQQQQRIKNWCETNSEAAHRAKSTFQTSQTFYQGAVDAWKSCVSLNAKDIHINPLITPDDRTVSIGIVYTGPSASGVLLYGIQTENFSCTTETSQGRALRFPISVSNQNVQVRCTRASATDKVEDGVTYSIVPRATITVQTASDPFQLYFAEERTPPAPTQLLNRLLEEIRTAEFPVGTIISSTLRPVDFFAANPTLKRNWVPADGTAIPANSIYAQKGHVTTSPDLTNMSKSLELLAVTSGVAAHGSNISSLITTGMPTDGWTWLAAPRDLQGRRLNNDFEQAEDHFQTWIDPNGGVTAQGSTFNFKAGQWGPWNGGSVNVLGLATAPASHLFYYVRIN